MVRGAEKKNCELWKLWNFCPISAVKAVAQPIFLMLPVQNLANITYLRAKIVQGECNKLA